MRMLVRALLASCLVVFTVAGCAESSIATDVEDIVEENRTAPNESVGGDPIPSGTSTPSTDTPREVPPEPEPEPTPTKPAPVTFRVLTYNIAGLPQGISSSDPLMNTPQISPKLNPFELVLVQEDFSYHDLLIASSTHAYRSTPMASSDLGDGLNALSHLPFDGLTRTKWVKCNGLIDQSNDCLTPKGFTRFVLDLGDGRAVDVYNVHFDAGRSTGDVVAREAQVEQLNLAIAQRSAGKAVIVAGDTNMKASDEPTLQKLLMGSSLTCACRALQCAVPNEVDRIMFRSSASVTLTPKGFAVEPSFVDASGKPLSDHDPMSTTFEAN